MYYWAIVMLIVILLGVAGRIVLAYAAGSAGKLSMVRDMRNDVYDKLQERYSHHEYEQIGVSSLVTRMPVMLLFLYCNLQSNHKS